jgi:tryptophan synthase alpha chain
MTTANPKRLDTTFDALKTANKKALIPFVTCGDPHPSLTVATLHALVKNGADVIELGMPFSDPVADGPVIEKASERAIAKGVDLHEVLRCVAEFRTHDAHTPIVLMGYLNPILQFGRSEFFGAAAKAGADAVLIVDCPIEESLNSNRVQGGGFKEDLNAAGLQQIFLVAPTSSPARRAQMAHNAEGFLYYVSFAGITGAAQLDPTQVHAAVNELKSMSKAPIAVGFGVKDAAGAAAIAQSADAVVIGSALVSKLASCENQSQIETAVQAFLGPIRKAISE